MAETHSAAYKTENKHIDALMTTEYCLYFIFLIFNTSVTGHNKKTDALHNVNNIVLVMCCRDEWLKTIKTNNNDLQNMLPKMITEISLENWKYFVSLDIILTS